MNVHSLKVSFKESKVIDNPVKEKCKEMQRSRENTDPQFVDESESSRILSTD